MFRLENLFLFGIFVCMLFYIIAYKNGHKAIATVSGWSIIICIICSLLACCGILDIKATDVGTVTKKENDILVIDNVKAYDVNYYNHVPAICKVVEPGDYVEITYSQITNEVRDCKIISN